MKRFLVLAIATMLILSAVGCAPNAGKPEIKLEGSLDSIMKSVYDGVDIEMPNVENTVITSENAAFYLGKGDIKFSEAIASEPLMSSVAHSICLLRVAPDADIEQVKKDIKENVDPRKWVCVGVEPENVVVDNIGDVVILIMDEASKAFHDSFLALKK